LRSMPISVRRRLQVSVLQAARRCRPSPRKWNRPTPSRPRSLRRRQRNPPSPRVARIVPLAPTAARSETDPRALPSLQPRGVPSAEMSQRQNLSRRWLSARHSHISVCESWFALMAVTNAPARENPGRQITHGRGFF